MLFPQCMIKDHIINWWTPTANVCFFFGRWYAIISLDLLIDIYISGWSRDTFLLDLCFDHLLGGYQGYWILKHTEIHVKKPVFSGWTAKFGPHEDFCNWSQIRKQVITQIIHTCFFCHRVLKKSPVMRTFPLKIVVQWKIGPSNITFLSFRVIFHFHVYGRKGKRHLQSLGGLGGMFATPGLWWTYRHVPWIPGNISIDYIQGHLLRRNLTQVPKNTNFRRYLEG